MDHSRSWRAIWPLCLALVVSACAKYEEDEASYPVPVGMEEVCEQGGESEYLAMEGILEGAEAWRCDLPREGSENALHFTEVQGHTTLVNGGSVRLLLTWAGEGTPQGRMLIVQANNDPVRFVRTLSFTGEIPNPIPVDLFFLSTARSGRRTLSFALDDGTGTPLEPHPGKYLRTPFRILAVKGGDVQININWDTPTDVDLHVFDPANEEIYFGHRTSASKGELDLDSNAACSTGPQNENIYWGEGDAPDGQYGVFVHYWSKCEVVRPTNYRVTILLRGEVVDVRDGSLTPDQSGGENVEVTKFRWPPTGSVPTNP